MGECEINPDWIWTSDDSNGPSGSIKCEKLIDSL